MLLILLKIWKYLQSCLVLLELEEDVVDGLMTASSVVSAWSLNFSGKKDHLFLGVELR